MEHHFRIAPGQETVPKFLKFGAKLLRIIQFSIINNGMSRRSHRLASPGGIDDSQTTVEEGTVSIPKHAVSIRPPAGHGGEDLLLNIGPGSEADDSGNAAHKHHSFPSMICTNPAGDE